MNPQYCSKGHENPPGSRFCLHCGEKLAVAGQNGIQPGQILGDRYCIIQQLGQGGFGRTYLAEDINRFREYCVLKEFAPQVQSTSLLPKAEELFEREAGVLYKLQHGQIPRFRELFRVNLDGKGYLFLVQDYVEGKTYHALLDTRRQQGMYFNEVEVTQLLLQILPVLDYIHSIGVIHRDISPDNIILRSSDYLPVLIDFGAVKQVAATVVSQLSGASTPATLLGKVGYAPHEQMQMGVVYPHSDLYALAATVLVLLTGKEPQELIDEYNLTWNWRREVNLSPNLGAVLDKMLSQPTGDRYQSARQVLQALTGNNTPVYAPKPPLPATEATLAVAPSPHRSISPSQPPPTIASTSGIASNRGFPLGKLLVFLLLVGAGGIGWLVTNRWLQSQSTLPPEAEITPQPTISPSQPVETPSVFSAEEQNRKQQLRDRTQQLGINYNFFPDLVNQFFWEKYPNQRGRSLSSSPEDAQLRTAWDQTANELLDKLQLLRIDARRQLGTYTAKDRNQWKVAINKRYVSSRALYDLTDTAFFELFPQQRGKNFLNQPIAQIWYALAEEKLNAILTGTAFERIVFDPGATGKQVSGSLKPGEGKVYIAGLAKDQLMKLDLQADPKVLLSVYSPTGKILLEDSGEHTLSTTLPEKGFYEFVVASTASDPIDYQLNLSAEDTTPAPIIEPSPSNAAPSPN
ncbi:MAG: protein kinase [Gloeocapsa sp. UFS-A4-WI-NPMV-4B04]|jgi:serine/threonine-protein kinase|nr:protein kinase [Gloeocapsa sp. UFS-A4-WI-NPMV-4B04]